MKSIKLLSLLMLVLVGGIFSTVAAVPAYVTIPGMVLASLAPRPHGVFMMALNQEIWQNYIKEQLYGDSSFLNYCRKVSDDNIVNGKIVHIPNAGSKPTVVRNRGSLPATIVQRTDADVIYLLSEYTTDPTLIQDIEKVELSYDKISSVLGSHMLVLKEEMSKWLLFDWLTKNVNTSTMTAVAWSSGTFVSTTGSAGTANGPNSQNVKALTVADVRSAKKIMDKANVPQEGRYLILHPNMFDELLAEIGATTVANMELLKSTNLQNGVLYKLYGFNIVMSTLVPLITQSTPTVVAPGTTEASTHSYAGIAFHRDFVEAAVGEIRLFENRNDATYFGDVFSGLVRAGGRSLYSAGTGVVPIVQAD
jgi:hypothetical protein